MHFYVILTSAILAGCVNAQFSLQFGTNAPAPAQISGKNNPFNTIYFKEINFRGMIGKLSWSSRIFQGNTPNTSMVITSWIGYSEELTTWRTAPRRWSNFDFFVNNRDFFKKRKDKEARFTVTIFCFVLFIDVHNSLFSITDMLHTYKVETFYFITYEGVGKCHMIFCCLSCIEKFLDFVPFLPQFARIS